MTKTTVALNLLGLGVLLAGYENCSPSKFSGSATSSTNQQVVAAPGSATSPDINVTPATSTAVAPVSTVGSAVVTTPSSSTPVSPRQTFTDEVKCNQAILMAPIQSDAWPLTASAPQSFAGIIAENIKADSISSISNFASGQVSVAARVLQNVQGAAQRFAVNASSIGAIQGAFQALSLTTRTIGGISSGAGKICVSAQNLGSYVSSSGSTTFFGRGEGGVRARIGTLQGSAYVFAIYDADISSISSFAGFRTNLNNVHLSSLSDSIGRLDLVDSTIDTVTGYSGTIHMNANS